MDAACENGVDAVIASDIAVLHYAAKTSVNIHISTQANVTNIDAVEFFAAYADVMVLSRELTLIQVSALARKSNAGGSKSLPDTTSGSKCSGTAHCVWPFRVNVT